jgi:hypothetical protein
MSYGLDNREIGFRFPAGTGDFSLMNSNQTGFAAHKVSFPAVAFSYSVWVKVAWVM